uniref:Ecdysteroid-regulated 16 kDa protein (Trinotate prediction) n=1 Tax=Henneguya salminicola TaxID=69463 RepID=A0A6G3MLN1_HENSL
MIAILLILFKQWDCFYMSEATLCSNKDYIATNLSIYFAHCNMTPCVFKEGDIAEMKIVFIPDEDMSAFRLRISTMLFFIRVNHPEYEQDGCLHDHGLCPLKADVYNFFTLSVRIPNVYIKKIYVVRVELYSGSKHLVCFDTTIKIEKN